MIKFNGWQRLWILLSGSYFIVVLVVALSNLPKASDISSPDILSKLSDQSLRLMANTKQWTSVVEDGVSIPVP